MLCENLFQPDVMQYSIIYTGCFPRANLTSLRAGFGEMLKKMTEYTKLANSAITMCETCVYMGQSIFFFFCKTKFILSLSLRRKSVA